MAVHFDGQARDYDDRAGLPPELPAKIAAAVWEIAGQPEGGRLLEIGAGTGQIGFRFIELPWEYLGIDNSEGMLEQFRQRLNLQDESGGRLLKSDANERWPAEDGSVDVIFSSRALHLLDPEHLVDEAFRVASDRGAWLLSGRVHRQENSVKAEMRRRMRQLLQMEGFEGKGGGKHRASLFEWFCRRGAAEISPVTAGTWNSSHAPIDSIESWRQKAGLAGLDLPEKIKESVLAALADWGEARYGDMTQAIDAKESFLIEGVRIPAK